MSSVDNTRFPALAVAISLVIGTLSAVPYLGYRFEYYPGDVLDARLVMYLLEHGYRWISGQTQGSFLDAPFYYPVRGVISYSENLLGVLPFYAPWRMLGYDRETAFQVWTAIGFLLNYSAAAWVMSKLRFHWVACICGAYVFTFSQAALAQMGHSQLLYRFAIPLAWYFLYRFLESFSWKHLLGCLVFLAWQFYCTPYLGYFLTLFLAGFVVVTILWKPIVRQYIAEATVRSVTAQIAVVLGFIGVLAALAHPYMAATSDPQLFVTRWDETTTMLPRPVSYLLSAPGNYETGWLVDRVDVPMKHEHLMFVGLIPWACVLLLLFTAKRAGRNWAVFPAMVSMLGIILLTLYVNGISIYFMLMRVPGVIGIRSVTRWIVVLLLAFSLAVAQAVHLSVQRFRNSPRPVALTLLCLAIVGLVVENHTTVYRFPKAEAQARLRVLATQLPEDMPTEAILAYVQPTGDLERLPYDLDVMLLAQDRNLVTINGYTSRHPHGYRPPDTCANLKLALDDTAQQNDAFPIHDAQSRIVVLGNAVDGPCTHLNAPRSVQTEPLPEHAFRAKIEVETVPSLKSSSPFVAKVRVTNESDVLWRAKGLPDDKYAMRVGCRWIDKEVPGPVHDYDNRFEFPYDVSPGDSALIVASLKAPPVPSSYGLECDAVQELVHWFAAMGSPTGMATVAVTGNGPALEGFLDRADDEAIAGWAWETDHPNRPVEVEIYDGEARLAIVRADVHRQDLQDARKGNGRHSFSYTPRFNPAGAKVHNIRARVAGKNFELTGSPKILDRNTNP